MDSPSLPERQGLIQLRPYFVQLPWLCTSSDLPVAKYLRMTYPGDLPLSLQRSPSNGLMSPLHCRGFLPMPFEHARPQFLPAPGLSPAGVTQIPRLPNGQMCPEYASVPRLPATDS